MGQGEGWWFFVLKTPSNLWLLVSLEASSQYDPLNFVQGTRAKNGLSRIHVGFAKIFRLSIAIYADNNDFRSAHLFGESLNPSSNRKIIPASATDRCLL